MAYTQQELDDSMQAVKSAITRCERIQPKFHPGTAQYSLLKNRLSALRVAQRLLSGAGGEIQREDLEAALPPIASTLYKTETARRKHPEGSMTYQRLSPTVRSMEMVKELLEQALFQRGRC